uniref:Uncharacterized protein n=1 Tax=Myoviridae sp. ctYA416 TaxID=2825125 RepID=A0A8S5UTC7_9CAUD|nr:MAG TPA: hypothetical protein [Myoviridae sp. ctYA416]
MENISIRYSYVYSNHCILYNKWDILINNL